MHVKRLLFAGAFALAALAASPAAVAAPCAGFTDVDDTSAFCPNVEWLKNRSITLGCTSATLYCPNDSVTRLAMAAFMNRLGTALTPVFTRISASNPGQNFSVPVTLCATNQVALVNPPAVGIGAFRRTAVVTGLLNAFTLDVGGMDLQATLVQSTDNGATWTASTAGDGKAFGSLYATLNPPGDISLRAHTYFELEPNLTYRFAIQGVRTTTQGGGSIANAYCEVHVEILNRTGTTSPFDVAVPVERSYPN